MWAQLVGWNQEGVGTAVAHCGGADVPAVSGAVTAQRGRQAGRPGGTAGRRERLTGRQSLTGWRGQEAAGMTVSARG